VPIFRPGKPWRRLRYTSTPAAISSLATITWHAADSDGDWSTSDLTTTVVGLSGLYLITGGYARSSSSGSSTVVVNLLINGVFVRGGRAPNVNAIASDANASVQRQLVAGDTITMKAQSGTGAVVLPNACGLEITRIGPVRWT